MRARFFVRRTEGLVGPSLNCGFDPGSDIVANRLSEGDLFGGQLQIQADMSVHSRFLEPNRAEKLMAFSAAESATDEGCKYYFFRPSARRATS
jgi:hypothetical protein